VTEQGADAESTPRGHVVGRVLPDVAALAARWNAAEGTLGLVRDGENAVYELRSGDARRFLRLTEDRHRSREQLEAELEFVHFVTSRGLAAASAVPSAGGEWVETADAADGSIWHAVVFAAVPGRHFRYFSLDIDRPLFRRWGSAMGRLHTLSREFGPATSRRRPPWTAQDTTRCDDAMLPATETEARREHARIAEWLASRERTRASWGLIHGDFERTNFVCDGTTLWLYDFDDACYHWYLADVAHALWAFRGAPAADRGHYLAWFLEGYREQCDAAVDVADVREDLSWFVRLRSLSLFLRSIRSGAAGPAGPWERRMRAGFEEPFRW